MAEDAKTLKINVYARTDVGMVRAGNEDTFLVLDLNTSDSWTPATVDGEPPESLMTIDPGEMGTILAVSDGMGGALAGEVASRMAVEGVRDRMLQFQSHPTLAPFAFHERLRLAVEQANVHINTESVNNSDYSGMGATFTAAGVHDGALALAQIGDSRCYLIRENRITLLTHDQSLVWQLVEAGHITEEEAETHQYKNVILQALGAQPRVNVVVDRVPIAEGDTILLCSDGLSGRVRADEMLATVTKAASLRQACEGLIDFANERGGDDNITVVLARFTDCALAPSDPPDVERIERDGDLPYDLDESFATEPEGTIPLGSRRGRAAATAASATSRLHSNAKTKKFDTQETPAVPDAPAAGDVSTTIVGMPALTAESAADASATTAPLDGGVGPPLAPAPAAAAPAPAATAVRRAPARSRRTPVLGILTAVVLVGAAAIGLYALQLRRGSADPDPLQTAQPAPAATPNDPTPAPPTPTTGGGDPVAATNTAVAPPADPFDALDTRFDQVQVEVMGLKDGPKRSAAQVELRALQGRFAAAKNDRITNADAAARACADLDRDLTALVAKYFPAPTTPLASDGR